MQKRLFRGMIAGTAVLMVLAFGSASADVGVTIDNEAGSTVFSLPLPPEQAGYPEGINTQVSGTASFVNPGSGSVLYQFSSVDPITGAEVVNYSGDAPVSCGDDGCTWAFTVPFILGPGEYTIAVTASEPDPNDPEVVFSASASVDVLVL